MLEPSVNVVTSGSFSKLSDSIKDNLNISDKLTAEQRKELLDLLDGLLDCFVHNDIPTFHGIEHLIDTGDAQPIGTTLRRTSAFEQRLISEQVHDMLNKGFVGRSSSPWAAQLVMVPKRLTRPRPSTGNETILRRL